MEKSGHYEVQDVNGEWHEVTAMQAAAYRCDNVPVRFVEDDAK